MFTSFQIALKLHVDWVKDVKWFHPLDSHFATPRVQLTMEDVILSINSVVKKGEVVVSTLLYLAKTLLSVFPKVSLPTNYQHKYILHQVL